MYACKIFLCARISTHRESERLMLFEPSLLPAYQIIPRRRDEIYIHIFRIFHFTLAVNLVEKIKKKKKKETSVINELFARSIHFFQSITTIFIVSRHVICPWPIPFLTTRLIFSSIIFFFLLETIFDLKNYLYLPRNKSNLIYLTKYKFLPYSHSPSLEKRKKSNISRKSVDKLKTNEYIWRRRNQIRDLLLIEN